MTSLLAALSGTVTQLLSPAALERLPAHVAVIMDGSSRWARSRNVPRIAGHQAGVDAQWSPEMGAPQIPPVTVARNLKEASIEAAPTPLRETFGSSPYSLGRVLARDDAPRKEVMLGDASFSIGWERFVVRFTPRNSHRRRAIPIHTAQFLLSTGSSPPRSSSTLRK